MAEAAILKNLNITISRPRFDRFPPKGHSPTQFSAHVRCGQTAGWTKMPLAMEVGLGPGDFVFDGDPATPEQRAHPPPRSFWPMFIVATRLDG